MKLVKITVNECGEEEPERGWCLVQEFGDAMRTVCMGEVFGEGEGAAEYETKDGSGREITCPRCRQIVQWYKAIKL